MNKILTEQKKTPETRENSLKDPKRSRNKMTLDRIKYFGHLLGGIKEVLHSRFISRRPRPFTFSHLVTGKCNCNCDFCFWKHHKENEDLCLEEIRRIYREAGKEGYMNSILWGGEPLLRQDFTEIAKASYDAGMYTKMATNGWFLQENHEFGKYMDLIFVSIDAIGQKHDELRKLPGLFDRCVSGIEFHKRHYPGMRIYACCTVSAANDFSALKDVAKLCKQLDILLYFTVNKNYHDFNEWQGKDGFKNLELENNVLADIFKGIKSMKKQGYPIRNSDYFIDYMIDKKTFYQCHWPRVATVMYSNGNLLRCSDRKPVISLKNRSLKEVFMSKEFTDMVNICKDCKLSCVGNYALDASGLWRFEWKAVKSLAEIAIT